MRLWNPYAFTPLGEPVPLAAPPSLRVIGGQAAAPQLSAAKDVFTRFCMHARLSAVPNPTEQGFLGDGTPYRIVSIGETRIMEIRPVESAPDAIEIPAIGVVVAGTKWLLRPPGAVRSPASGRWAAEEVIGINGGVGTVYRADDKLYFVEGALGTSRGNKRLTDSLFGMGSSIYLSPETSHLGVRVSDPFMFGGWLEQLKVEGGGNLRCVARKISKSGLDGEKTGAAGRKDTTSLMPPSSQGDYWGLLTAHSDKKKIVACRIASDLSSWFFKVDNVRESVVMWRDKDGPGMSGITTMAHPISIAARDPFGAGDAAPRFSRWERDSQENDHLIYETISNPFYGINPAEPPTYTVEGQDGTSTKEFTENCIFSGAATFRRYIDFSGEVREDTLKYEDKSEISSKAKSGYYGFLKERYNNFTNYGNYSTSVNTTRTGTITLFGVRPLKVQEFIVEMQVDFDGDSYWREFFSHYTYNEFGNITGGSYGGTASAASLYTERCSIKYAKETILMHDSQFGVAATLRVAAETTLSSQQGYPRISASAGDQNYADIIDLAGGKGGFPPESYINTATRTDKLAVEIVFYSPAGRASTAITVPPQVHLDLLDAMNKLRVELSMIESRGDPDSAVKSGTRQNGYMSEELLKKVLNGVSDYVVGASYAKDPKTGAGFFSCTWDDGVTPVVVRNKVVGPWGWAPAFSKTPIADGAQVLLTTSV